MNRRRFLGQAVAGTAALTTGTLMCRAQSTQPAAKPAEITGRPHLDPVLINDFVTAGHGDLAKVKEMLAQETPAQKRLGGLIMAQRELGMGDFETALGGAAHMGLRDIALYLVAHGARIDAFAATMLGYRDVVFALLKAAPETATTRGPHLYSLLYHAAISGDIQIAEDIKPLLPADTKDYNQALHAAARAGHLPMTQWLLANGVTDVNAKDTFGNSALTTATKGNFPEVAAELRKHGAT